MVDILGSISDFMGGLTSHKLISTIALLLSLYSNVSSNPLSLSQNIQQIYNSKPPVVYSGKQARDTLLRLYPQVKPLENYRIYNVDGFSDRRHKRTELIPHGVVVDIDGDNKEDLIVSTHTRYEKFNLGLWAEALLDDSKVYIFSGQGNGQISQKPTRTIDLPKSYHNAHAVDLDGNGSYELVIEGHDLSGKNITAYSSFVRVYRGDIDWPFDLLYERKFYGTLNMVDTDKDGRLNFIIHHSNHTGPDGKPTNIQDVEFQNFEISIDGSLTQEEVPKDIRFAYAFSYFRDALNSSQSSSQRETERVYNIFRRRLGSDVTEEAYKQAKEFSSKQKRDRAAQILKTPNQPLSTSIANVQKEFGITNPDVLSYVVQSVAIQNDIWVYNGKTKSMVPLTLIPEMEAHPLAELILDKSIKLGGYETADISPETKKVLAVMLTYTGKAIYNEAGGEFDPRKGYLVPGTKNFYVPEVVWKTTVDYIIARDQGRQPAVEKIFMGTMDGFRKEVIDNFLGDLSTSFYRQQGTTKAVRMDLSSSQRNVQNLLNSFSFR